MSRAQMKKPMDAASLPALVEMVRHLSTHDPKQELFGARDHEYRFRAPLSAKRLRTIESEAGLALPEDYRAFLQHVGDGGAGPHHGLLPLDVPCQRAFLAGEFAFTEAAPDEPEGDAQLAGTIVLADMGCCYFSLLVVRAPREARSGLRAWAERQPRKRKGTKLTVAERRAALGTINDAAIAFRSSTTDRFFDEGDPVQMCVRCHRMASALVAEGALQWRVFAAGGPPRSAPRRRPTRSRRRGRT